MGLLFAFRSVEANPSQGEGISDKAENRPKNQRSDSKGEKEFGLGRQTDPEAGLDKTFFQSEPKNLRKNGRIKLKSYDFHPHPGCHRVVRNNPPGKIRPGPEKDSNAIQSEQEGNGDTPYRMEAQKRGEPKKNA